MLNFEFYNPTRIVFGKDKVADLARLVPADARVLVLYGGASARTTGTLDEVKAALGARTVTERCRSHFEPRGIAQELVQFWKRSLPAPTTARR